MKRRRRSIGAALRGNEAFGRYTSVCFVYRLMKNLFDKKGAMDFGHKLHPHSFFPNVTHHVYTLFSERYSVSFRNIF